MKITFKGTRGYIDASTRRHRKHSMLMLSYYGKEIMIDCGENWLNDIRTLNPHAILITHAHPDHAYGLKTGAPAPVYATKEAWEDMEDFGIENRHVITPLRSFKIHRFTFKAFPVVHSTKAPAVGFRIQAGHVKVFYIPDVVWIEEREKALKDVQLYIGDGATITRSMVRKIKGKLIGHTPIRTQLTWCQKEGVPRAIFTHLGSAVVAKDERTQGAKIRRLGRERNVDVEIAHDGMELVLR